MATKDRRTQQTGQPDGDQAFKQPSPGAVRSTEPQDLDEDARVEDFSEPAAQEQYAEDASANQMESASGVPRDLMDLKAQIEAILGESAQQGAVQAEDAYQGVGNIVGVGIGLGETHPSAGTPSLSSGFTPGEHALNIYVAELTSIDEMKAAIVESVGSSALSSDTLPLNLIQTGLIEAQPHPFRIRPAPGGVSVAHFKVTAGTIGCLSVGNHAPRNSRLMVLSNNHVLANVNAGAFGDCVCQPGPFDGGRCPADQIAILERFVPINFAAGTANVVDCATAWTWPDRVRRELVFRSGATLNFFRISSVPINPALGMIVGKTGRTTQLTTGRITGVGVSVNVNYGAGRVARFIDQIAIQSVNANPFSAGGDSGSSIWTWNPTRNPVGLLFAGGGGVTFANRMTRVIAALDIHLFT